MKSSNQIRKALGISGSVPEEAKRIDEEVLQRELHPDIAKMLTQSPEEERQQMFEHGLREFLKKHTTNGLTPTL